MTKKQEALLKNLISIPSPSGFESKIAEFIQSELLQVLPKTRVKVDFQNNVTAVIKGTSDKVLMIDAHLDQIAYIVTNIDKKGFISLGEIGGHDTSILSARDLIILTDKGKVNAVVNRRHSHLVADEDEETINNIYEALVDIGPRSRAKVTSAVKIGDPVIYRPSYNKLRESYVSGYGFDDKAGCFILMEVIKEIVRSKMKVVPTLVFTFSSQEETGGGTCKPLVRKYKPDLFIEVDVTFASDWSDSEDDEREAGRCELGKGVVIYRGVGCDVNIGKLIASTAKHYHIKIQCQASYGQIGYTSDYISSQENGIRACIIGIPLRNMHTSAEIINLKDLNTGTVLLTKVLLHRNILKVLQR